MHGCVSVCLFGASVQVCMRMEGKLLEPLANGATVRRANYMPFGHMSTYNLRCPTESASKWDREVHESVRRNIKITIPDNAHLYGALSKPPITKAWNVSGGDLDRGRGTMSRNSSQVRCSMCLKHGHAGSQCPTQPCSQCAERGHVARDCPVKEGSVI